MERDQIAGRSNIADHFVQHPNCSPETEVRQMGKMEAMGRLSGAIAHDLNNFLTGITGFASLLLEELEPGVRAHEQAREIPRFTTPAGTPDISPDRSWRSTGRRPSRSGPSTWSTSSGAPSAC